MALFAGALSLRFDPFGGALSLWFNHSEALSVWFDPFEALSVRRLCLCRSIIRMRCDNFPTNLVRYVAILMCYECQWTLHHLETRSYTSTIWRRRHRVCLIMPLWLAYRYSIRVIIPWHSVVATLYIRMPWHPLTTSKVTLLQHTCIVPWW
jgi:hypothetical protein